MKAIGAASCIVLLLVSAGYSSRTAMLKVDGKVLDTYPKPAIRHGRLFIPATSFRKIGLAVEIRARNRAWVGWPASDDAWQFEAGNRYAIGGVLNQRRNLPGIPFMHRGVLIIPLQAVISTSGNAAVEWDNKSKVAHIHRSQKWLRWRIKNAGEFEGSFPQWYTAPI